MHCKASEQVFSCSRLYIGTYTERFTDVYFTYVCMYTGTGRPLILLQKLRKELVKGSQREESTFERSAGVCEQLVGAHQVLYVYQVQVNPFDPARRAEKGIFKGTAERGVNLMKDLLVCVNV